MSRTDRTGETFGQLTVVSDTDGGQLLCRCSCGREGLYPRALTKPSYRGPKACPWCLGTPCEECGEIIPNKGRMPAKTCSPACAEARKNRRERERYERIKDTPEFQEARAAYLKRLEEAMTDDPALAESIREDHRRAVREWRGRQQQDPEARKRYVVAHRESERRRLQRIRSDPVAYADHLRRQREWYHSLSAEDYRRIFIEPRSRRK